VGAFVPSLGVGEDPVTGGFDAGRAHLLAVSRTMVSYVANEGTVLGRASRGHVRLEDAHVSVGGERHTIAPGSLAL